LVFFVCGYGDHPDLHASYRGQRQRCIRDNFDGLGPGDTTPASRWPSESTEARATLYRTGLAAEVITGIPVVTTVTTTTATTTVTTTTTTVASTTSTTAGTPATGVLSCTVTTPAADVTPAAKTVVTLGTLLVTP